MQTIIGVDEVGRGAWAGPLVVGAVKLKDDIPGLKDSKKLTKKQRENLAEIINETAEFIGLGWVTPQEIDDFGLTKATTLACKRALKNAPENIKIIIDGSFNYLSDNNFASTLINADDTMPSVSASSIVAKVARDKYMAEQAVLYKVYGFATNVGYGTSKHHEAIKNCGLTPIHRWSLKPITDLMDNYEA